MKYDWKKGMSLSFFQDEQGGSIGADTEILRKVSEHGFDCVELSFSHDDYFYKYKFGSPIRLRHSHHLKLLFCMFFGHSGQT